LNIASPFRIFEPALAFKNEVCSAFIVLNILFTFRIFEQLAPALENSGPEIFHCRLLNTFFSVRIFEQLALALINRVVPCIHSIEYIFFIIQEF